MVFRETGAKLLIMTNNDTNAHAHESPLTLCECEAKPTTHLHGTAVRPSTRAAPCKRSLKL